MVNMKHHRMLGPLSSPGDWATTSSPTSSSVGSVDSSPPYPPWRSDEGSASSPPLISGSGDSNSSAVLLRFCEELFHLRAAWQDADARREEEVTGDPVVETDDDVPLSEAVPETESPSSCLPNDTPAPPSSHMTLVSMLSCPSPGISCPSSETDPDGKFP